MAGSSSISGAPLEVQTARPPLFVHSSALAGPVADVESLPSMRLPPQLVGLWMLAVLAHWAYHYLGVAGVLAWHGLRAIWQALV